MGFWSWLTGKPKGIELVDHIWINQEAKFRGLCKEAQEKLPTAPLILVTAHFPSTLDQVRSVFAQRNLAHRDQESRLSPSDFLRAANGGNPAPVIVARADALAPDEFPNPLVDELPPFVILVAERHFLRSCDDRIVDFARSLGRRCRLSFHLSLEDPLMRVFVGEWVGQVLMKLGMTDSQAIESAMVGRRIKVAQAKLAKRVIEERKADSAEEWLQWNVPGQA
jgi:preprotein translocase subunit SecA